MRMLNSLLDDRTPLGLIVWACILTLVGIVLALISLAPIWVVIVLSLCCVPYIFGAVKENRD